MGDDLTTSPAIDLNEPMTLTDLLDKAGVPDSLGWDEVRVVYAGCGSHGVELSWEEPFFLHRPAELKAGWEVNYPAFRGVLTEDPKLVGDEVVLTMVDRQIALGSSTVGGAWINARPPRPGGDDE